MFSGFGNTSSSIAGRGEAQIITILPSSLTFRLSLRSVCRMFPPRLR